jgi:hypothetical protein
MADEHVGSVGMFATAARSRHGAYAEGAGAVPVACHAGASARAVAYWPFGARSHVGDRHITSEESCHCPERRPEGVASFRQRYGIDLADMRAVAAANLRHGTDNANVTDGLELPMAARAGCVWQRRLSGLADRQSELDRPT